MGTPAPKVAPKVPAGSPTKPAKAVQVPPKQAAKPSDAATPTPTTAVPPKMPQAAVAVHAAKVPAKASGLARNAFAEALAAKPQAKRPRVALEPELWEAEFTRLEKWLLENFSQYRSKGNAPLPRFTPEEVRKLEQFLLTHGGKEAVFQLQGL